MLCSSHNKIKFKKEIKDLTTNSHKGASPGDLPLESICINIKK